MPQPLHIGIVGCSVEGAALCYREICTRAPDLSGAHAHPEVSFHTSSLSGYVACLETGNIEGAGALLLRSAKKLHAIGADFLICPDNTIPQPLDIVLQQSPLPWLHIAHTVAAEAQKRGFTRVGLTGTRWLVESRVYPDALDAVGIQTVLPDKPQRREVNRIIMDELVAGIVNDESVAFLCQLSERLHEQQCDAMVLGCTELPLVLNDENCGIPVLDSTRLLAHAAIEKPVNQTG